MKAPAVFVSSTFYDPKQIRADLRDFITQLDLIPIISEFDSFPIDPSVSAVENCLKVVDQSADIFVLIIRSRLPELNRRPSNYESDQRGKSK